MRGLLPAALPALLALALLTGCNTTDALTPPMDVGGGTRPSPPITQADANRLAASPSPDTGYGAYQSAPLPPVSSSTMPGGTLEEQARAVDQGRSSPVASAPLPGMAQNAQNFPAAPAPPGQTTAPVQPTAPAQTQQPTAAASGASIRFLPIIGAPVEVVAPLSKQLGASARASGLTIRASTDSSDQILKGYLSAFEDEGQVTVVYVWDVLDGAGQRLHRIQGQEKIPSKGGDDPWRSVPAPTMELIGQKTIAEFNRWRETNSR
ncbi:hypothetical protein [Rhizobium oryzicola]|uniref:hypothetical protein n=1 Tax=Rhizobium oryzicola TaxID=1232668 RepID=UPI003F529A12